MAKWANCVSHPRDYLMCCWAKYENNMDSALKHALQRKQQDWIQISLIFLVDYLKDLVVVEIIHKFTKNFDWNLYFWYLSAIPSEVSVGLLRNAETSRWDYTWYNLYSTNLNCISHREAQENDESWELYAMCLNEDLLAVCQLFWKSTSSYIKLSLEIFFFCSKFS